MLTRYFPVLLCMLTVVSLDSQTSQPDNEILFQSQIKINKPSDRQIHKLYKLCKIWGYLKYKHPEIAKGNIDWDAKLFTYLDLIDSLSFENLLFDRLPKTEGQVVDTTKGWQPKWIKQKEFLTGALQDYLIGLSTYKLLEKQQYVGPGHWNISPSFKEKKYPRISYQDDGVKLLALFRYWNIIEYFFPYKALMDQDWDRVLMDYIPRILATSTELEAKLVLLELTCEINDGHGGIHNDEELTKHFGQNQIPIQLKIIEEKAYVTRSFAVDLPITFGDRILEINGKEISEGLEEKEPYVPASTQAAKNRILSEYILRTNNDVSTVKVRRGQQELYFELPTKKYNPLQYVQRNIPSSREISDEIVYIYPGALKQGELDTLLAKYKDKASIIFDYRSYPSANIQGTLPNFLLPVPQYAFKSKQYSRDRLGEFIFMKPYKWGQINESYYKGNFIILVNEYTQSQAEFEILIYSQAPNVKIFGSSTAGAIGNWTPIYLPGDILTSISGNGIFQYDESPVQRIGIIPDIYLESTVEGIKDGRDELLQAAIRYCEEN